LKGNRKLLNDEIALLEPELIVLVGRHAAHIAKLARTNNDKRFISVPFPSKWRTSVQVQEDQRKYHQLHERLKRSGFRC
jgi:uracil-DNA glycosylase